MKPVTSHEIWERVYQTTRRAGFPQTVAEVLADSTTEAELHGKSNVGLNHLFYYFQAARKGLINVDPTVDQQSTALCNLPTGKVKGH